MTTTEIAAISQASRSTLVVLADKSNMDRETRLRAIAELAARKGMLKFAKFATRQAERASGR